MLARFPQLTVTQARPRVAQAEPSPLVAFSDCVSLHRVCVYSRLYTQCVSTHRSDYPTFSLFHALIGRPKLPLSIRHTTSPLTLSQLLQQVEFLQLRIFFDNPTFFCFNKVLFQQNIVSHFPKWVNGKGILIIVIFVKIQCSPSRVAEDKARV